MYGQFTPYLVYGVEEKDNYHHISFEFLEEHGIEYFVTEVIRGFGCKFVYGISIELNDFEVNDKVDNFCKKFNLGIPTYHLCISGDYEICHEEWLPEGLVDNLS